MVAQTFGFSVSDAYLDRY